MGNRTTLLGIGLTVLISMTAQAAEVLPPVNPENGQGAEKFSWQVDWGSLHLNSFADGLNDPGSPASVNGTVPCDDVNNNPDSICMDAKDILGVSRSQKYPAVAIDNGIKYDIKNSVLNCMSRPVTNWPKNHSWSYALSNTCVGQYPKPKFKDASSTAESNRVAKRAMIYLPLWDARGTDDRDNIGNYHGCQQQVINNCANDIHECVYDDTEKYGMKNGQPLKYKDLDDGPGYKHPSTHVFTAEEVADLGGRGASLPNMYFKYEKIVDKGTTVTSQTEPTGNYTDYSSGNCAPPKTGTCYTYAPVLKTRVALSRTNPTNFPDRLVTSPVETIDNTSDANLDRIGSFYVANPATPDTSKFIIIDPSQFFDLTQYKSNGPRDTGYNVKDSNTNLTATYETCPILGTGGYGGICDPTGKAGCNLPIYKVGATTKFTVADGKQYSYANYPVAWSGYVKKWAQLTREEYLRNTESRREAYVRGELLNDNPILMLTRANEYCDIMERVSNYTQYRTTGVAGEPDMPCIQYIQYQDADGHGNYHFVDLFDPSDMEPGASSNHIAYDTLHLYNIDKDGKPITSEYVKGKGDDRYVNPRSGSHSGDDYLSFADYNNPDSKYNNEKLGLKNVKAVERADYVSDTVKVDPETGKYVSGKVFNTEGQQTAGTYLGYDEKNKKLDTSRGAGIPLEVGTTTTVRMKDFTTVAGKSVPCVVVSHPAQGTKNVFVPTNTQAEFQAFVKATEESPVNGVVDARSCGASFMKNSDAIAQKRGVASESSKKTVTWTGMTTCDDLTVQPACNQSKTITARRFCQLESGNVDSCEACRDADEGTDISMKDKFNNTMVNGRFQSAYVQGEVMKNPFDSVKNRCAMIASCVNRSTGPEACPAAPTGGHVFCLSPETKITMADGSQKSIGQIKAGEKVRAFDAKLSKNGALKSARVKAIAVTKDQTVMVVNDVKITPNHKMIMANGRAVAANEIKVGDSLLKDNGMIEPVTKVERNVASITVYNLVLEKGVDGYIAGGKRVIAYPDMKGLAGK